MEAIASNTILKKKTPKSVFHEKKVVLDNVKHSGDEKNISLSKFGSNDSVYSDVESLSGKDKDVSMSGTNVNTGTGFGSLLGFLNFHMDDDEVVLPPQLLISLKKKWIDSKIVKTPVEVSIRKSFALDINFSAVEESLIKAISLAREKRIIINSDLKKQRIHSDWAIVIKEILMDMPKKMIVTAAVVEFTKLKQAKQLVLKWSFLIEKNSVHMAMAVGDHDTWMSRDHFRALLFTLPVGTTAYDFGVLLERAGRKTCVINCSLETGNWTCCAIVGFKSENELECAFYTEPIFGGMKLSWVRLDLVQCKKYGNFRHLALECDAFDTLVSALSKKTYKKTASEEVCVQLARLYAKKNVLISYLTVFDSKSWAQIVSFASSSGGLLFESGSGSGSFFSGVSDMSGGFLLTLINNLSLNACLLFLKHSLELLGDQVSGILHKLDSMDLVPLVSLSSSNSPVTLMNVELNSNSDIVLKSSVVVSAHFFVVSALGLSSSKILTTKVGCLESKLVAFEASIGSVLVKLDQLCASLGLNVPAKQNDVIWWHMSSGNMKFDSMQIFTSGLEEGFLGAGVAVIMNKCLVQHISKILISIVRLYTSASIESRFSQAFAINSLIAKAVNSSTFVVLGGDFNENGKGKSVSVKFCSDLGLINSFVGHMLVEAPTWSNSRKIEKTIDFIFVSCNLSFAVVDHKVGFVVEFFNTNHQAVLVSIGLGGLVNSDLNSLHKQANRNKWKFKIKDADAGKWLCFRECLSDRFAIGLPKFNMAKNLGDLDTMWDILREAVFFRLELLVAKIVKSLSLGCTVDFAHFLHTWYDLDETKAFEFEALINNNVGTKIAFRHLAGVKKKYHKSKYYKFRMAKDNSIRKTIDKHMENFSSDKEHMIQNVLNQPVQKVVLDYLIVDDNLILDSCDIKSNIDTIMEGWTRKHIMPEVLPDCCNLPDGKTAGLSGIINELWKHCDKRVLSEGILTNTRPIALIKTVSKVLSKLLLDRISLACSKFNVFQENVNSQQTGINNITKKKPKTSGNICNNKFKVTTTPDTATLEFNIPDGIEVVKKSVYQYIENCINNYLFGNYNISEVRSNLYNNVVHYSQLGTEDLNSETLATYFQELNFNIIEYCEEKYSVQSKYSFDFESETETSNKGKQKLKQYSKTTLNTPILPKTTAKHLQTPEQGTTENTSKHSETLANKENVSESIEEEVESEEESELTDNEKEDKMTAYIAKIPKFNGEDIETSPQEWLDQVTKAGDTNGWNFENLTTPFNDWTAFKTVFLEQFTDNNTSITLQNHFHNIKQEPSESVMTYIGKFNKLLRQIRQLETNDYYSNTQILDQFIAGLKDKLIKKVCPHAPEDLATAIQQAKNYEMAMEEANRTKLVNLVIGETSSAAEEKIDQLTKKVKHYFTNQQQQQHLRIAITVESLATGKEIAESYNETNKIGVINVTLYHNNLIINYHYQLTIHQDPNTKVTIISLLHSQSNIPARKLIPQNQFTPQNQYQVNNNRINSNNQLVSQNSVQPRPNHYHTQSSYLTMPEEQDFHHIALSEANESPFLLSNATTNKQKAITAMYTEAEVERKPIHLILDSRSTGSIITYQLMQQLKRNINQPAQTIIVTANGMKKTPVGKIDNFPFTIDEITILVKVLVMDAPQYQALIRNNWLQKANANLNWKTQELTISYQGQHARVLATCSTFNKHSEKAPAFEFKLEEEKPIIETFMALGSTSNWADETEQQYFSTYDSLETKEPVTPGWNVPYSKPEPRKQCPYIPLKCKDCHKKLSSMRACILPEEEYENHTCYYCKACHRE
ncbi:hypothetical protein G9A89_017486 [Geosiphon pyriformis]|nr:hypothetical protein G9A89_017486 [Geosiphon pyriformis]